MREFTRKDQEKTQIVTYLCRSLPVDGSLSIRWNGTAYEAERKPTGETAVNECLRCLFRAMAGKHVPCDICRSGRDCEQDQSRCLYVGAAAAAWLKERGGQWIFHPHQAGWLA